MQNISQVLTLWWARGLSPFIRLGWKGSPRKNTLDYFKHS
jgi:hypothetical protein